MPNTSQHDDTSVGVRFDKSFLKFPFLFYFTNQAKLQENGVKKDRHFSTRPYQMFYNVKQLDLKAKYEC